MKKLTLLLAGLLLTACAGTPSADTGKPLTGYSRAVLTLRGMSCPLCANNVDGRLTKVPGIDTVKINLETGKVIATFSVETSPTREQIKRAVKEAGFTLANMELLP